MSWEADVALACRSLVGTVFAVAVASKVHSPAAWRSFRSWLADIPVRPTRMRSTPVALTATEAAVVVLVATPSVAVAGLVTSSVVLLALTAGLAMAVRSGAREPCHCFGASQEPMGAQQVARNAVLLAITVAGSACAIIGRPVPAHPAEAALAVITGLSVALLLIFSSEITALLASDVPGPGISAPRAETR